MKTRKLIIAIFCLYLPINIFAASPEINFIHISDSHIRSEESVRQFRQVLSAIRENTSDAAFVINTGDLTEFGSRNEVARYQSLVDSSDLTIYSLIGNHDTRWSNAGKQHLISLLGPRYQSFDAGSIHFILLDSGMLLEQYGHFSPDQLQWVQHDLASITRTTPVIVACHHPLFLDQQFVDNEWDLLKQLEPYNIIAFLCGHGHRYRHWQFNNIDFIMGPSTRSNQAAFLQYRIRNNRLSIQQHDVTTGKDSTVFEKNISNTVERTIYKPVAYKRSRTYNDNLPILFNGVHDATISFSLDRLTWQPLQHSGTTLYANIDIRTLCEGLHAVYLKQANGITHIQKHPFRIHRGGAQLAWQFRTNSSIQATPLLMSDALYIGSNDGVLYALKPASGEVLWKFETDGPILSTPAVWGDTLATTSLDGHCYALDRTSGQPIWQQRLGPAVYSSPAVSSGRLFVGSGDSALYALSTHDGAIQWRFQVKGFIKSTPVVQNKRIVFGCWDRSVYCVSADSGTLVWSYTVSDNPYYTPATSNPLIVLNTVYITSHDHTVHALNIETGVPRWQKQQTPTHQPGYSSPANFDDKVIFGSLSGHVFALNEVTGDSLWTTRLAQPADPVFDSSPWIQYPFVFVGSIHGVLYGLDFETGKICWQYKLNDNYIFSSPVADRERVYIGSCDGSVYAVTYPQ